MKDRLLKPKPFGETARNSLFTLEIHEALNKY
jgi:hypothetical protein